MPERYTTLGHRSATTRAISIVRSTRCERALAISPNYALAIFVKGRILAAMGRYDEAIQNIQLALDQPAENPAGWRSSA